MKKKILVIGAGFSGLAGATILAKHGMDVELVEKHAIPGGRARKFSSNGFTFDMGPSWYWMPDIINDYFSKFDRKTDQFFNLERLDPSYRVYFEKNQHYDIPANFEKTKSLFHKIEKGSGNKLDFYVREAEVKYNVGIYELAQKPSLSFFEFMHWRLLKYLWSMHLFTNLNSYISRYFTNPHIKRILEFPSVFLGGTGKNIPAIYSLMSYVDMRLGTWYPQGGMYSLVDAMHKLAIENGVNFHFETEAKKVDISDGRVTAVETDKKVYKADCVLYSGDYWYFENNMIPNQFKMYSKKYWENRVMTPSTLIFFIGINKKLNGLLHHTLFFDSDFEQHAKEIYETPQWPTNPAIYVSVTSKTDPSVAPKGHENLMVLIPVAAGLTDTEEIRSHYLKMIINKLESTCGQNIRDHIVFERSYAHNDFFNDYYAFKGNAYGLANTLMQTAILKPKLKNSKLKNLYFCGHLTVPGPGVPTAIISGKLAAEAILKL